MSYPLSFAAPLSISIWPEKKILRKWHGIADSSPIALADPKILLVDNDAGFRTAFSYCANSHQLTHCQAIVAKSETLLDKVKGADVVIIDYDLDINLSGVDVAAKIKRVFPDMPIVLMAPMNSFMHAHTFSRDMFACYSCKELGAEAVITDALLLFSKTNHQFTSRDYARDVLDVS